MYPVLQNPQNLSYFFRKNKHKQQKTKTIKLTQFFHLNFNSKNNENFKIKLHKRGNNYKFLFFVRENKRRIKNIVTNKTNTNKQKETKKQTKKIKIK